MASPSSSPRPSARRRRRGPARTTARTAPTSGRSSAGSRPPPRRRASRRPTGPAAPAATARSPAASASATRPALSPQYCLRCLSVAAKELADGCPAKRRAAVWTDDCFASFADTSALSPDEAAFHYKIAVGALVEDDESSARFTATLAALAERLAPRAAANASRMLATATVDVPRVVAGSSRTVQVHSLAQCMPDRPAASCARCVQESARELGKCCWNMQSGGVATVIGYNCHLRLDVSVPMTPSVAEPQSIPAPTVSVRTTGGTGSSWKWILILEEISLIVYMSLK